MCIHREETSWRRGGTEEASSWRDSRREDTTDRDRGERRDRDRRDDREIRAPPRDQDEGVQSSYILTRDICRRHHSCSFKTYLEAVESLQICLIYPHIKTFFSCPQAH